jgi:hypothetical protein
LGIIVGQPRRLLDRIAEIADHSFQCRRIDRPGSVESIADLLCIANAAGQLPERCPILLTPIRHRVKAMEPPRGSEPTAHPTTLKVNVRKPALDF